MKKIFASLALLATVAFGANAQESDGYRRTWDFTKGWSEETIQKLEADPTNWEVQGTGFQNCVAMTANETPWVVVDGEKQPIAELEGMTINSSLAKAKHCQICTTGSGLAGVPCFWLNGKGDVVSVKVPAGENVRFGYTAHGAQDRGFSCSAGFADANGAQKWTNPDNQEIHEIELINSNEGESTLSLKTENGGCHIYYIIIGAGDVDPGSDINEINIAYLYDSSYNGAKDADKNPVGYKANGGLDEDPIYAALSTYNVVAIDYNGQTLTSAELNDSLQKFDVVVAGECVSSGNALAKGLVEIVNKVPMLNLKSFMYKKGVWGWGAGVNPSPKNQCVTIPEDYLEDPLFADLEILFTDNGCNDGILPLFDCEDVDALNGNLVQAYSVNEDALIANDEVLAKVGDNLAIHRHGDKNQYLLIPLSSDNLNMVNGNVYTLIDNAVKILAATKSKVLAAATPVIAQEAADQATTVSITCTTTGSTIYYTTDGTEPTEQSPVYSEPFVVTQDSLVVKAIANAHGYNVSKTATAIILVKSQAAAPAIAVENLEGQAIITLTPAEGTIAYFSFNGITEVANAQAYTEPIVIREPATITAFAASVKTLPSEAISQEITVGGIPAVKDTVAHFDASVANWFDAAVIKNYAMEDQELPTSNWAAKAAYYWGKSAWAYYSDEVDHTEPALDEEGNPLKDIYGNDSITTIYKPNPEAVKYVYSSADTQWRLRSQGQVLTGECSEAATAVVGNGNTGYFAESATDLIGGAPSKGKITFGGKTSGDPYTASIESTVKFQPPFDIVTYLTNGGTGEPGIFLQTSVDGENWESIAQLTNAKTQRYFKKDRNHVEGTEELYVRVAQLNGSSKAQLYDLYIITTEGSTGIEQIAAPVIQTEAFDLYGRQLQAPVRGQLFIQNGKKMIVR